MLYDTYLCIEINFFHLSNNSLFSILKQMTPLLSHQNPPHPHRLLLMMRKKKRKSTKDHYLQGKEKRRKIRIKSQHAPCL